MVSVFPCRNKTYGSQLVELKESVRTRQDHGLVCRWLVKGSGNVRAALGDVSEDQQ